MSRPVTVVVERPPAHLATGVRRRLEHHLAHLATSHATVRQVHLYEADALSLRESLSRARRVRPAELAQQGDRILVVGLGDVGLMIVADAFSRDGYETTFDQCDSMSLQLAGAVRAARVKDAVWGVLRVLTRFRMSPAVDLSYISARDRRHDVALNLGRRTSVIPPNVDPALLELGDARSTLIGRVSVPADFSSPHLAKGLDMLWNAIGERAPIDLDLFGPAAPEISLPPTARYRGFADDIRDVYAGDTAVFIANVGGAGVPNKLLEAASARRPVIVHPSVRRRVELDLTGWTYRTSADIRRILNEISTGVGPRAL